MNPLCDYEWPSGVGCTFPAKDGTIWCRFHNPDLKAEREKRRGEWQAKAIAGKEANKQAEERAFYDRMECGL